jgi:site-specific DNA-methyltransferase (adenine-specific)
MYLARSLSTSKGRGSSLWRAAPRPTRARISQNAKRNTKRFAANSNVDTIRNGDCLDLLASVETGTIDLVFADPPFNIGYQYDAYHDRHSDDDYIAWCKKWIGQVHRVLKSDGTFWLAIGDEYAADLKVAAERELGFITRSWVIWYYTFGVNCTRKFSRSHAHLFHFVKQPEQFTFNAEDPFVRVPSARALVYGDKRANPTGRLPDDTWILRPHDLPDGFQSMDSTWYFARVAGTFKERQGFHGCQMPEQLLGRIIRVSSNPGEVVLDPFAGSGTTLATAKKLGRRWLGFELSSDYVKYAGERLASIHPGDPLDGPVDAIASAPSTANGRRLKGHPLLPGFKQEDFPDPPPVVEETWGDQPAVAVAPQGASSAKVDLREVLQGAIIDAFYAASDGHSIDWLLADPALQTAYHEACREAGLIGSPVDWNRELLRLRKTGKFPKRGSTKKGGLSTEQMDPYAFAAEIAWRLTADKFRDVSLDDILCDPEMAAHFDRIAKRFAPGFAPREYRWAALRLRKAGHNLSKEARRYHYVFATRDFTEFRPIRRLRPRALAGQPGLYLLRGRRKAPLYVGETLDLGRRLALHAAGKSREATHVGLILQHDLPSAEYREPLKVDLAKRYGARWNVELHAN